MQITKNKAFTLVELLVVITILAIISVVAYQNFGGAVDKAVSGRKISDISTIETSLQQYKADKNYYPPTDEYSTNNLWGYTGGTVAQPSNTIAVEYDGLEILSISASDTKGGGRVYGTGTLANDQIGAKGTISRDTLGKKYLSKDLYDPELGDLKVGNDKMSDSGIGRYVYATYKKGTGDWSVNKRGIDYNLAFTIRKTDSDKYVTKIVGSFDRESCYLNSANELDCPDTLIGTLNKGPSNIFLEDNQELSTDNTKSSNQGIPYAVTDFAKK